MEELKQAALALSLFGGVYDLLTKRIPNWLSFGGIALGLLALSYLFGWAGLFSGLSGCAVGFLLYFPLFYFHVMGAGDVKLLMLVGAWTSTLFTLRVAVVAILCGGGYAAIDSLLRGRLAHVLRVAFGMVSGWLKREQAVDMLSVRKFSFGWAIAVAVALVWSLQLRGLLP